VAPVHRTPHAPQLLGSLSMLMHAPPQHVRPRPQAGLHVLASRPPLSAPPLELPPELELLAPPSPSTGAVVPPHCCAAIARAPATSRNVTRFATVSSFVGERTPFSTPDITIPLAHREPARTARYQTDGDGTQRACRCRMHIAFRAFVSAVAAALVAAACGGSSAPDIGASSSSGGSSSGGSSSGGSSSGGSSSGGHDAGADAGYLACIDAQGKIDPSFKACSGDGDCAIRQHETSCCGTSLYVGIATSRLGTFDTCETAWDAHFPGCGCPSGPAQTEDGKTVPFGQDAGAPQVHCSGGLCMTYLP
jgi:hypothetical protein